jgi:5-formyltetrahydrofolate cyclo-ligase
MTEHTSKQELRKFFLQKRKSLTEGELVQANQSIYHLFFQHFDLSFIKVIHTYLPLEKNHEPDTWQIIDRIRREFPHVRIAIPKISGVTNQLENIYFEGLHQIELNVWGIPEPKQGIPVPLEKIDFVIVPLLIFDKQGNRVGYGKGFYDRFLKECRPDCKKIGFSFFDPIDRISDAEDFDVKLDGCITPSMIYSF